MKKQVSTPLAPAAIGPYSQSIVCGKMQFISGQLPINPATGQIEGGIQEQTHQSIKNIKAIVEAAGGSLDNIVKTTVFLKDMNQFGLMNEVYSQYFTDTPPARAAVEVARLPKDALVEIEAIIYLD